MPRDLTQLLPDPDMARGRVHLRVSLYALMLACAGVPLYIHLPRFASVNLGIGLATLGTFLLVIRLADLLQDPLLGWAIDRWPRAQGAFATAAGLGLALGFPLLFWRDLGTDPVPQLLALLILLFTAYSLGSILLYARSTMLATTAEADALLRLAAFREGGMLAGVLLAVIAPALLLALGAGDQGYPAYGLLLGALALIITLATRPLWHSQPHSGERLTWRGLQQSGGVGLLLLALINSLPVAITSTLFLFFVEDRLMLPGMAGPLLLLFFLSAGLSLPLWTRLSLAIGPRATLLIAMPLAILGFVGAGFLPPGQLVPFALICLVSGAAVGADMVILPTLFSAALARKGLEASLAFGLWSFAGKFALALAAFATLPWLERNGFVPGAQNSAQALETLTLAYAFLPCLLKLAAFFLLLTLPKEVLTK